MKFKKRTIIKILVLAAAIQICLSGLSACSIKSNKGFSNISTDNTVSETADSEIAGSIGMEICEKAVISGDRAFVINSLYGLHIIDITNKQNPKIENTIKSPQSTDVCLTGGTIYIADYKKGLITADLSDIKNPKIVKEINNPNQIFSIYCTDDYLFTAAQHSFYEKKYSSLIVYDIKDKHNPAKIKELDELPWITDIFFEDGYAYMTFDDTYSGKTGLIIADILKTDNPKIISRINTDGFAVGVTVREKFAYIADNKAGLKIIDISLKQEPFLAGSLELEDYVTDIALSGRNAYVSDGYCGIKKIDLEDIENPKVVSSIKTLGFARAISVYGEYIYISDGKYFTIANVF